MKKYGRRLVQNPSSSQPSCGPGGEPFSGSLQIQINLIYETLKCIRINCTPGLSSENNIRTNKLQSFFILLIWKKTEKFSNLFIRSVPLCFSASFAERSRIEFLSYRVCTWYCTRLRVLELLPTLNRHWFFFFARSKVSKEATIFRDQSQVRRFGIKWPPKRQRYSAEVLSCFFLPP